jgi:hypothetical protein
MTAASVGPWKLDFSAAQMNQTVLPGEDKEFWLVVYATGASDLLLTLGTIRLTLAYDNISQTTPAPPEPALIFAFRTIAVAGQSSIVADSSADTLTIAAGDGITLTTNAGTDTLTISSNASGSGDVVGPASATDDALARFNGTTGKLIQSSTATLTDAGLLTVSDAAVTGTLTAAHIHGNLAGSVYSHVRNESGGVLAKGTPVYVTGFSVGQSRPLVGRADSASAATMPAIGILDEELANNASGHCVITGIIENIDTSGLAVNAPLYVASGGGLTATAPDVRAQPIAIVERVNVNNGAIIVTPAATNGSLASQSAASVSITGGSIGGLSSLSAGAITASTSATVTSATASTSTTTGALVVTGGVGVGGAVFAGSNSSFNGVTIGRGGSAQVSAIAIGTAAGSAASGSHSISIGFRAGRQTTSSNNVLIGGLCAEGIITGASNVVLGYEAYLNGNASQNIIIGTGAARALSETTSNNNVIIGTQAGRYIAGGTVNNTGCSGCVFIGRNTYPSASGQVNSIIIGDSATGDGNNTTVIGTSATITTRFAGTATSTVIISGNELRIANSATPTETEATVAGGIKWGADYLYVATAANTWKRIPLRSYSALIPISEGGTGASTAAGARASLGLETVLDDATTARTLASADAAKYIRFTSASAITITIPTNATDPIPIGSEYFIRRANTGAISLSNAGVTVNNSDIANLATGRVCCLKKVATDTWDYI